MYRARMERVLLEMEKLGLEQMILCDRDSIWYLTGYDVWVGERMYVLFLNRNGNHKLFLNKLFPVPDTDIAQVWYEDADDCVGILAAHVDGTKPLGIDKEWPARFLIPLMERCPGSRCVLASRCVDDVRACKDDTEQELMRKSSAINDAVMLRTKEFIREGMTEKEIARFMTEQYIAEGCESDYWEPLVCFGANAADPHHEPDDTRLKAGDCIVIDTGGRYQRYCSDMTRTFFCKSADPKYLAIHDLVRSANELAEAMVRPGIPLRELDRAARDHIAAGGYGEFFTHRLGHFIGQRDHEQGDVSASTDLIAKPGMIFSIEPGVYLPGQFGVRVEDLVLVTETGCEILNRVDKHACFVG